MQSFRLSLTCSFVLSLTTLLVLAGCSSGDKSPCKQACAKYTKCNAPKDKGVPDAGGGSGKDGGGKKDSGGGAGSFTLFMAGGPGSGSCSYSEACSSKEQCFSACINSAPCSALTGKDIKAANAAKACINQCNLKKWDAGVKKDKGKCQPKCSGKQCGNNGCGGQCGQCPTGKSCNPSGQCVPGCQPKCSGKQCGNNGCGGQCGQCPTGQSCNPSGNCVPGCQPNCSGRQCGNNGCGGSCGTCPTGQTCDTSGKCQNNYQPNCSNKECGPDGCGSNCGTCPTGETCSSVGICEIGCQPQCSGKKCGPDSCGGTCGTCKSYETCDSGGQCTQTSCGPITDKGCCDGTTLKFCQSGTYKTLDCSKNPSCGWSSAGGFYDCGTSGISDPGGTYSKTCP